MIEIQAAADGSSSRPASAMRRMKHETKDRRAATAVILFGLAIVGVMLWVAATDAA